MVHLSENQGHPQYSIAPIPQNQVTSDNIHFKAQGADNESLDTASEYDYSPSLAPGELSPTSSVPRAILETQELEPKLPQRSTNENYKQRKAAVVVILTVILSTLALVSSSQWIIVKAKDVWNSGLARLSHDIAIETARQDGLLRAWSEEVTRQEALRRLQEEEIAQAEARRHEWQEKLVSQEAQRSKLLKEHYDDWEKEVAAHEAQRKIQKEEAGIYNTDCLVQTKERMDDEMRAAMGLKWENLNMSQIRHPGNHWEAYEYRKWI